MNSRVECLEELLEGYESKSGDGERSAMLGFEIAAIYLNKCN